MGFFRKSGSVSLEKQLAVLAECGVRLRDGFTIDDLLYSSARESFEADPYQLVLFVMGSESEEDHQRGYLSNDIWHFDTECIEDDGDYVRIFERLRDMAAGDFPVENIRGSVDLEANTAWIEFEMDGSTHRFEPRVDDDWVDPKVFSWVVSLLKDRNSRRRLIYQDLGGQDFLTGFADPASLKKLQKKTGLPFVWLT